MKKFLFSVLFIFLALFSQAQTAADRETVKTAVEQWVARYNLDATQMEKAYTIQLQKLANIAEVEAAAKTNAMSEDQRLKKMIAIQEGAMASLALSFDKAQNLIYGEMRTALRTALNRKRMELKKTAISETDYERSLLRFKSEFSY